ncbi:hypothetical protein K3495_g2624 [Podosphaera aphanis]|nr:hypothetical protein K3495_g2624 [Podosphaera aphanis]
MTLVPTHYDVLNISEAFLNGTPLQLKTLRAAYRRALLQNHPDKSKAAPIPDFQGYSIDQISEAFSTLSNPKAKAEYDHQLKLQKISAGGVKQTKSFRVGVETVDLDDLQVDDSLGIWYRSCRCGDNRGFLIQETDLEAVAEEREIHVECKGCSLRLKVLFGVCEG